jgi:hypothetical protein
LACAAVVACVAGCGDPRSDREPRPGESLVGIMREGELERIATEAAAALRNSQLSAHAARPLRVAPPDWRNATDVPVDQPAAFVDEFTSRINDRCGANVQFLRRPWVRSGATPEQEGAAGAARSAESAAAAPAPESPTAAMPADYQSRITLLPHPKRPGRSLRLRTEILAADGADRVFVFEEEFQPEPTRLARAQREDRRRAIRLEQARAETPGPDARRAEARRPRPPPSSKGRAQRPKVESPAEAPPRAAAPTAAPRAEIRFANKGLAERVRFAAAEPLLLPDGRLEFSARLRTDRKRQKFSLQVFFQDEEGRQVEVSRPVYFDLRRGRAEVVRLSSQLPAAGCVVLIDKY